ncbi:luciferase family protein [Microbacterium sp. NPDC056052]|uniref:luciferase domain-containing protein n=1 Tax=Microbacterium sp. NPDC056052 TaxID=3345695 RepID=UPI0035E25F68
MSSWEATVIGRSNVSAPTSRAIHMNPGEAHGPVQAFFVGTEFVHLHGDGSGSVHATLPPELADAATAQGWGETHPVVKRGFGYPTWVMLYGPRTSDELAVVAGMLQAGYRYARFGETPVVELAGER